MRSIGYKTFDSIINEDYDKEEDDCKRMLMIVDEIDRLCHLNDDELRVFLNEAKKITEYNCNTLLNKREFLTRL
jgi:endo-alpha-1,4-polygalactosaminidase (GH114 family)